MKKSIILLSVLMFMMLRPALGLSSDKTLKKDRVFSSIIGFQNGTGENVSLKDFKGEKILLILWATWCVPCVKEIPSLDRLQKTYPKLRIIPLSLDKKGVEKVEKFYKKHNIKNLKIYTDVHKKVFNILGVKSLPYTILYDKEGATVGYWDKSVDFDDKNIIREILLTR